MTVWMVSNGLNFLTSPRPTLRKMFNLLDTVVLDRDLPSTVSVAVISALSSTFTPRTVLKSSLCSLLARPRRSSAFATATFAQCKTAF